MNLATIRARLLAARNWESSGATFNERLRQAVDTAYHQMAADAASAIVPDDEHVHLLAQVLPAQTVTSLNTQRYLAATTDPWVLEFLDSTGAAYIAPATGMWLPTTDGTWDGIMHIEFQDSDGSWHRRQSREWWTATNPAGELRVYVSLDRPYTFVPGVKFYVENWRIYQPLVYLSSTARKIHSVTPWDPDSKSPLVPMSQSSLLQNSLYDIRGDSTSELPRTWSAGPDYQLPSPTFTPTAIVAPVTAWAGPHNTGTFKFAYTIVQGKRGPEWQTQPGGTLMDPMWESMPSTPTPSISNPTAMGAAKAITLTLPDTDFSLNFGDASTLRASHTGLRKRIYVAIEAVDNVAPWTHPFVDTSSTIYYLLDEVDGSVTTYTWTGAVLPDRLRRMPTSTGYSSIGVWPQPTRDSEMDVRLSRNPQPLVNDTDTPRLAPDSFPAFLELCLYHLCLMDGVDLEAAMVHQANYEKMLGRVVSNHSTPGGTVLRRPAVPLNRSGLDDWRWSGGPARRSP